MLSLLDLVASQNPWWREPRARVSAAYPTRRDSQVQFSRQLLRLEDRRAVALVGPRQVGKTVALLQTVDDLLDLKWPPANLTYFDFSDPRVTTEIVPTEVAEIAPPGLDPDPPRALLFDEISRAANWDLWLKGVVDRGGFRVGVTDSASSLLRGGGRDSGQGRWDQIRVEGLSFAEALRLMGGTREPPARIFAAHPDHLERYLRSGGFPEHLLHEVDSARGRLEIARRLREDVVESAVYRDLARYEVAAESVKNLFVYLVEASGAIFNAAERAQELGRDYRTVQRWLFLLEEAGLIATLPRFAVRPSRRLQGARSVKVYAADHGLVSALSSLDVSAPEVRGRVFEAVVFRHLRELARTHQGRLSYFRVREDLELDFVVEVGGRRVAVEVTSSPEVRPRMLAKVRAAAAELGAARLFFVHGGLAEAADELLVVSPLSRFLLAPEKILEEVRR
jgi:predicted AAA+ superfamily ATPase